MSFLSACPQKGEASDDEEEGRALVISPGSPSAKEEKENEVFFRKVELEPSNPPQTGPVQGQTESPFCAICLWTRVFGFKVPLFLSAQGYSDVCALSRRVVYFILTQLLTRFLFAL